MIAGFLTGSRVYGKPRDESDLDLCLLVTRDELDTLRKCCDSMDGEEESRAHGYPPNSRVLRYGKLNVLCFVHNNDEAEFFSFALGTAKMLASDAKNKDNRDTAVATFQSLINAKIANPAQESV